MSKSKIVGMMALIAFALGIFLVGDAVAEERGKITARDVHYAPAVHTLKVPDVENHISMMYESKGISFPEKWGACLVNQIGFMDLVKGQGTCQGYNQFSFRDGSIISGKWEGSIGPAGSEGTWTFIKGTGKFNGIQGAGTWKGYMLSPERWYSDWEGEYRLP